MAKVSKDKITREQHVKSVEDRELLRKRREYVQRLRHRDGLYEHRFWIYKKTIILDQYGLQSSETPTEIKDDLLIYKYLHSLKFIHRPGPSEHEASFYFYTDAPIRESEGQDDGMVTEEDEQSTEWDFVAPAQDPLMICDCPQPYARDLSLPSLPLPMTTSGVPLMQSRQSYSITSRQSLMQHPNCSGAGSTCRVSSTPSPASLMTLSRPVEPGQYPPEVPQSLSLGREGPDLLKKIIAACRPLQEGKSMSYLGCKTLSPFPGTKLSLWISSPNMAYVPEPPIHTIGKPFSYFRDGHLGPFEYAKWPQAHYHQEPHCMAVPANPHILSYLKKNDVNACSILKSHDSNNWIQFCDQGIAWMNFDSNDRHRHQLRKKCKAVSSATIISRLDLGT